MYKEIKEGKATVYVPKEEKISKDLPVFYNPIMEYNRTMTIELLKVLGQKQMQVGLPLAGTGVRGVRMLKELPASMIKSISFNDRDPNAIKIIQKNITKNKGKAKSIIHNQEANIFLTLSKGFDYIDIDPFGSPNVFLAAAAERLSRGGILGVTATDTSALCGTYVKPCRRKYWATPLHTEEMHEAGLRILIRKVQLVGAQFDRALTPILSYSRDHYMRIFFYGKKSKKGCDEIIKQHGMYKDAGPLWLGPLKDTTITKKIKTEDKWTQTLLSELDVVGFYEIPKYSKKKKLGNKDTMEHIMGKIKAKGYKVTRTQFSPQGIKTNIPEKKLITILKSKK